MPVEGIGTQYAKALTGLVQQSRETDSSGEFQNILTDALNAADATDAADQLSTAGLLSGDTNSLSDAVIATEKAYIALDLTVQIRNKAIDAYNEVMRMQV